MPSAIRGVMFIGTYNNIDTTICEAYIESWTKTGGAAFASGQLEKGEKTGTIHLQYFIHMKEKSTLSKLKSHCTKSDFTLVK